MIKKFCSISYGAYRGFEWGNLDNFEKINIFYGRNYSGKTTLSRIVRSLELGQKHQDYQDGHFEIELKSGKKIVHNFEGGAKPGIDIRVYNTDFVKENLGLLYDNSKSIKAFKSIILGDEANAIHQECELIEKMLGNYSDGENQASGLRGDLEGLEAELVGLKEDKVRKEKELEKLLSDKAREIKIDSSCVIQGTNYTRVNLENDIRAIRSDTQASSVADYRLDDEKKNAHKIGLKDEVKSLIDFEISFDEDLFERLMVEAKKLVSMQIPKKVEIEQELRMWLNQGLELHKKDGEERCKFCENKISEDRMQWLLEKVRDDSEEKTRLLEKLDKLLKDCKHRHLDLQNLLKGIEARRFYKVFETDFETCKEELKGYIQKYNEELEKIERALQERHNNPFGIQEIGETYDYSLGVKKFLEKIKEMVGETNEITKNYGGETKRIREELRLDRVACFVEEAKYFDLKEGIDALSVSLEEKGQKIADKDEEIRGLEREIAEKKQRLSSIAASAKKINEYLQLCFYHNGLELREVQNENGDSVGEFEVARDNVRVNNLSEGECSLIAFCYFMAQLEDVQNKQPIVWIDDPISSLDGNHVFFIFSLIKAKIVEQIKENKFLQLFVSTHNLEFLGYLRQLERCDSKQGSKKCKMYLVAREKQSSFIKKMPSYWEKYFSEYIFLFEQIFKGAKQDDSIDYYGLGNIIRRFLEFYFFFKYPDKKSNECYEKFFVEKSVAAEVGRIVNEFSHSGSRLSQMHQPLECPEMRGVCQKIIDAIKEKDLEYYQSLVSSINQKSTSS